MDEGEKEAAGEEEGQEDKNSRDEVTTGLVFPKQK